MDADMVQQMTGCSREEAEKALLEYKNVLDAIDALTPANPVTSGSKYIPKKPVVNTGMDEEQAKLCERGRWLQDQVNAVFSVAHSQVKTQLPSQEEAASEPTKPTAAVEASPAAVASQ